MTTYQTTTRGLVRFLGTAAQHKEGALVALAMFAVTALYEMLSLYFVPSYSLNMFEFVGTWSGLVCVWLTRTQNILCWPWGIVSSLALGYFFMQIGLPGQQWLNWVFFVAIQVWGWPYWVWGGAQRQELPVTSLAWKGRMLAVLAVAAGTAAVYMFIGYIAPGSLYPWLDSTVVAASVVAQFLLGRKKVESWLLWLGPVNMLSICLFFLAGAYTLMALYVAFFIHAAFAIVEWRRAELAKIVYEQ